MTAKLCAFARAYHAEHGKQKIANDYLASDLMGAEDLDEMAKLLSCPSTAACLTSLHVSPNQAGMCPLLHRYIEPIPLSRLAYTEEQLDAFVSEHGLVQYVILGAGLDTFAFRNSNRKIRVFEVDHPTTQAYKMAKVKKLGWSLSGHARFVGVDFVGGDLSAALLAQGFDPSLPTFFAIPGVSYYLPHEAFDKLLGAVAGLMSSAGVLMFDVPERVGDIAGQETKRAFNLARFTAELGEPMTEGYTTAEMGKMLAGNGMRIVQHATPRDIQTMYFDGRDDGQIAYENVHFLIVAKDMAKAQQPSRDYMARNKAKRQPVHV